MTPTARSLERLRKMGWPAEVVEHRLSIPGMRHVTRDLFGFGDILAIGSGFNLLIQTTTGSNLAARVTKAQTICLCGKLPDEHVTAKVRCREYRVALAVWLSVPHNRAEGWGWALRGARGQRKVWTLRRVELATGAEVIDEAA